MRGGRLLIDMHVHLARYKVLSDSTREWFISLYPSETVYQAVCDAYAAPEDFCAMAGGTAGIRRPSRWRGFTKTCTST